MRCDFTISSPLTEHETISDISLIKNNARVAAQIAVALERVETECESGGELHAADIPVVIGGSILDTTYRVLDENLEVSCIPFACHRPPALPEG
jgi:hypothetical protein